MCVSVYVCMLSVGSVYISVCGLIIYMYVSVYEYVSESVHKRVSVCICDEVCVFVCIFVYVSGYMIFENICVSVHTYI